MGRVRNGIAALKSHPNERRSLVFMILGFLLVLVAGSLAGVKPGGCPRFTHVLLEFGVRDSYACWKKAGASVAPALWWDTIFFIPVYATVLFAGSRMVAATIAGQASQFAPGSGDVFVSAVTENARTLARLGMTSAFIAAGLDVAENVCLNLVDAKQGEGISHQLPLLFSLPKWVFIGIAGSVALRGYGRLLRQFAAKPTDLDLVGVQGLSAWERNTRVPDGPPPGEGPTGIGIALSGGGIRSATFAMGAVQGLQDSPLTGPVGTLDDVRFITAVSGGGYYAGARQLVAASDPSTEPFRPGSFEEEFVRRHGKYLADSGAEWLKALMQLLAGLFLNLGFLLGALLVIALPVGWFQRELLFNEGSRVSPTGWMWGAVGLTTGVAIVTYLGALLARRSDATGDGPGDVLHRVSVTAITGGIAVLALVFLLPALGELGQKITTALGKLTTVAGTAQIAASGGVLGAITTWLGVRSGDSALKKVLAWVKATITRKGGKSEASSGPSLAKKLRLTVWLPGLLLGLTAIYLFARFSERARGVAPRGEWTIIALTLPAWFWWFALTSLLFVLYILCDETAWSLHPYYRRRLATAFSIERAQTGSVGERPYEIATHFKDVGGASRGPKLILCCAANLSGKVAPPGRKALSFTFSEDWVGGPQLGYVAPSSLCSILGPSRDGDVTVLAAMAISGAAVTSAMGRHSMGSVGAALAVFNVRLGVWLPSPDYLLGVKLGWAPKPGSRRLDYVVREILGAYDAHDPYLYISDGGHVENLGVVELLRRRCKTIFCFDGSGGPLTLLEAVSLASEELGVEIEFHEGGYESVREGSAPNLEHFPPEVRARIAAARVLVGKILYPEVGEYPAGEGTFVYARAVLTPSADDLVIDHATRSPFFPNDPTGDQWFDVEQFNSYLALGRAAGTEAAGVIFSDR